MVFKCTKYCINIYGLSSIIALCEVCRNHIGEYAIKLIIGTNYGAFIDKMVAKLWNMQISQNRCIIIMIASTCLCLLKIQVLKQVTCEQTFNRQSLDSTMLYKTLLKSSEEIM